ncbi:hypothetical protein ABZ370_33930 [Streptomyces sp. NPDC005962]|uniref:hypothetical protein n=1 Tax=Streptomyces sp. NPDC005962 TaxID=3154466 RepID=UPI0033F25D9E
MALAPLTFLGNCFEERLRDQFTLRRGMRAHAARVVEFEREVAARNAAEVRTRRAAHPDPAEVVHRATAPGARCGNGIRARLTACGPSSATRICPGPRR